MGKTILQKILARASDRPSVDTGEVIVARPHVMAFHDASVKYVDWWEKHDLKLWDPARTIFCFDHLFRATAATDHARIRAFAKQQGVPAENIYDIGRHGLQHQVPAEEGWVLPGTLYVGADAQSATMGALACAAFTRASEIQNVAVTGDTWILVPETIKVVLHGERPATVLGKDIFLRLMRDLREIAASTVLEFTGSGIESISVDNRMAIVNGAHLMGCETMVFPPDQILLDWVTPRAREPFVPIVSDADADYRETVEFDLSEFTPLISAPPALENVKPLTDVLGTEVHLAFIGSCGSARYEDLALAATVLKGKKVHPRVRLVITPISSNVLRDTAQDGIIAILVQAGATITTPGCGGCYAGNQSPAILDAGEVCITSSAENGPGRMGSPEASIYIGNAAVVAASAIEGQIADPAAYLRGAA